MAVCYLCIQLGPGVQLEAVMPCMDDPAFSAAYDIGRLSAYTFCSSGYLHNKGLKGFVFMRDINLQDPLQIC